VRCDVLRSAVATGGARPRSYHGLVDPTVRECVYVRSDWSALPELSRFLVEHVEPVFGVRTNAPFDAPLMVYRYGEGVGFVPHHDEVTEVELERAAANGQPVVGGDLTIVAFLSEADEYAGGELFFPKLGASFKPPAGSVVVFPATRAFIHGVAPIGGGTRFTCVGRCWVDRIGAVA
jgi:PKHD-type hydroxylase